MTNRYRVVWFKTCHVTGTKEIKANSTEEAEEIVFDQIGDYEGSEFCYDGEVITAYKIRTTSSIKNWYPKEETT